MIGKTTTNFPCKLHVSTDCTIHQKLISAEAQYQDVEDDEEEVDENYFQPVIILLPMRIGIDKIPEYCIPSLKFCLTTPFTIGIVGGKQDAAIYFVGFQDEHFIYLDPHHVHAASEIRKKVI